MRRAAPGASRRPGRVCEPLCERARGCAAQRGRDRGGPSGAPHAERTAFLPPVACACRPPLAGQGGSRPKGAAFQATCERACYPLWQRHIRCTPCAWWQGHPGHALCSKECGRCGLVTRAVRCCARHPRHTTLGLAIGGSRRIRIQVSLVRFPGRALWHCEGARGAALRQGLSAPPSARGVSTSPAAWPLLPAPAACGGGLRRRLAAAACGGGLRRLRRRAKGDIWCVSSARLPPRM